MTRRLIFLLALLVLPLSAWAHKASDSYLVVSAEGAAITAQWDIALRDIDFALGLDGDGNGEITWGELRTRRAAVEAWALSRLELARGGPCALQPAGLQVDTHSDGGYAVLQLAGTCPQAEGALGLRYRLLFDLDGLHRGLLRLTVDGTAHSAVLGPDSGTQHFGADTPSRLAQFGQYLVEGIWHIWIGFDHILFLLALLLPAVLVRSGGRWQGVARLRDALHEVLWVVTAFTVAHSITLSVAVLGWISLPSRLVESAIAASVVLAAANNLWPLVERRRWMVAFGFGLIHGFGFASVLAELGLAPGALLLSLFAFNVGVEVGQLAIVAAFIPAAYALRNTRFYRQGVFVLGTALTLLIALVWLVERVFDLQLMSGVG
ncbi:HupE/UreJ family protein [Denitromonas iodatirespirans]|uniref:HupE/UreJ family protein n=1 Tax=Denitromonas iodatirespirans TaxID=2795389 RepID=A0A944DD82_DENI1|nr:HupE/UreJ family protein [Denitromonas iodatirespirans]MBT0963327.1 HupE/UreJ family protein [Denitromonas iodatirespirans]